VLNTEENTKLILTVTECHMFVPMLLSPPPPPPTPVSSPPDKDNNVQLLKNMELGKDFVQSLRDMTGSP
jgi:hypothetical protein